jgi:hypothetical protein
MKIYYFSDETFLDMKNTFELSFKDDLDKQFQFIQNINIDRNIQGSGIDIWKYKTEMIINAIKENTNEIIIISDIDIIFYKPVIPIILQMMANNEICFQKEYQHSGINIGFISILCNETTLQFWEKVYTIVCNTNRWDQEIVNDLIYNENYDIKWDVFPSSIWNWSQENFDKDIILHHANCVSSKEGKYEQLDYIKNVMDNVIDNVTDNVMDN